MQTLEELQSKIDTAEDLRSVVKTMKALAALSIRHFEEAVEALGDYSRTVELGLQVALRGRRPETAGGGRPQERRLGVIVMGSDQGMCGQFNEEIAEFAARRIAETKGAFAEIAILAVGLRAPFALEQEGWGVNETFSMPASLAGTTDLVRDILLKIDEWNETRKIESFVVFGNRPTSRARYEPRRRVLLPVEPEWLEKTATKKWAGRTLPQFTADGEVLLSALIRQRLLVSVYQSVVESQAAENASRMASMQAAEKNIGERIEELYRRYHQQRQTSITAELLDIVGGFEALGGEAGSAIN